MRRIDSAALRCPRAVPPTHGLLLATRESLFAPVLYSVCCLCTRRIFAAPRSTLCIGTSSPEYNAVHQVVPVHIS